MCMDRREFDDKMFMVKLSDYKEATLTKHVASIFCFVLINDERLL